MYIDMKIEVLYWPGLLGPDPHWLPEVRLAAGGDRGHGGGQRRGAGAGAVLYCTVQGCTVLHCTGAVLVAALAPPLHPRPLQPPHRAHRPRHGD